MTHALNSLSKLNRRGFSDAWTKAQGSLFHGCSSLNCLFLCSACLKEEWNLRKKGDQAAITEDKKKKKKKGGKKGKGKSLEGEDGGDDAREGEKALKKKKEKVKKKKKSKAPVERTDGGQSSEDEMQPQVPLSGPKTELWVLGLNGLWSDYCRSYRLRFAFKWISDTWMHHQRFLSSVFFNSILFSRANLLATPAFPMLTASIDFIQSVAFAIFLLWK